MIKKTRVTRDLSYGYGIGKVKKVEMNRNSTTKSKNRLFEQKSFLEELKKGMEKEKEKRR